LGTFKGRSIPGPELGRPCALEQGIRFLGPTRQEPKKGSNAKEGEPWVPRSGQNEKKQMNPEPRIRKMIPVTKVGMIFTGG
jgi:hypothetical protein